MPNKFIHFLYMPLLGLGLYNGYRGETFLRNRIKILKQFVIPSLQSQTNKNFVLWISVRYEDKNNKQIKELQEYMAGIKEFKTIWTFNGICFYDDKYPDDIARERLISSLRSSIGELLDTIGEVDEIIFSIQPSDDVYNSQMVEEVQNILKDKNIQACGYSRGYIMNYQTKEVKNYNPTTNPPFYSIRFPREIFVDPLKHLDYTKIRYNFYNTKYPLGTPLPSHEYLKDVFGDKYAIINKRGFLVGTHSFNISTNFNIPFAGEKVGQEVLKDFGLENVEPLKIKYGIGKKIYLLFPYKIQRKLRYWRELLQRIITMKFLSTTKTWSNYWKRRQISWNEHYFQTYLHPHRNLILEALSTFNWLSLMEIGVGGGANLLRIIKHFKNKQVGGIDINPDAIKFCEETFNNGIFKVNSADDIMMSNNSTDVVLSDDTLIYVSPRDIGKYLNEIKRITRNHILLCEFHSESWWRRLAVRLKTGYYVYDWPKLLDKYGFYDIQMYKLKEEDWPECKGTIQEGLRHIILAKVIKV